MLRIWRQWVGVKRESARVRGEWCMCGDEPALEVVSFAFHEAGHIHSHLNVTLHGGFNFVLLGGAERNGRVEGMRWHGCTENTSETDSIIATLASGRLVWPGPISPKQIEPDLHT